jgi:hypothetical protein
VNHRLTAAVLLGGGATAMIGSLLMSTPTSARPGTTLAAAHKLPALRYTRPAEIAVQHNPFAPLVDATPRPSAAEHLAAGQGPNGTPYTANASTAPGTPATGPSMVLCATWLDQAAFRVGSDAPEIAGVGDVVGGYRVAKIDSDGVDFASGERLDIQDCMGTDDGTIGGDPGKAAAPAPMTNAAPAFVPDPSIITAPDQTPNATLRTFTAPSSTPAPSVGVPPVEYGRVPSAGAYGSTLYGQQPPTPNPNYIRRIP